MTTVEQQNVDIDKQIEALIRGFVDTTVTPAQRGATYDAMREFEHNPCMASFLAVRDAVVRDFRMMLEPDYLEFIDRNRAELLKWLDLKDKIEAHEAYHAVYRHLMKARPFDAP